MDAASKTAGIRASYSHYLINDEVQGSRAACLLRCINSGCVASRSCRSSYCCCCCFCFLASDAPASDAAAAFRPQMHSMLLLQLGPLLLVLLLVLLLRLLLTCSLMAASSGGSIVEPSKGSPPVTIEGKRNGAREE